MTVQFSDLVWAQSMGLIGACVSRDMRSALFPNLARSTYLWRANTISLMSKAPTVIDVSHRIKTKEDFLTFHRDINKDFDLKKFFEERFILIDFYRDVYQVLRLADGRYVTKGLQFEHYELHSLLEIVETIDPFSRRYVELWYEAFKRFCHLANDSSAHFFIVPVYCLPWVEVDGKILLHPWHVQQTSEEEIRQLYRDNLNLGFMQRVARHLLQNSTPLPLCMEALELDHNHEYGAGPYHYKRSYFEAVANLLKRDSTLLEPRAMDDRKRQELADQEVSVWLEMLG